MAIDSYTYGFACLSFLVLTMLLVANWRRQLLTGLLIFSCLISTVWAALVATSASYHAIPWQFIYLIEILRNLAWAFFILRVLDSGDLTRRSCSSRLRFIQYAVLTLTLVPAVGLLFSSQVQFNNTAVDYARELFLIPMMGFAILGLLLIEQLHKSTDPSQTSSVQHICLGLGSMYAYEFFMYSDAILFKQLDPELWLARGLVAGITVPFIATSVARNRDWALDLHVSRDVVINSFTLFGAGIYLTVMALAAYFIRHYGATWGGVVQTAFLAAAILLLAAILCSGRIRAYTRVLLSKHFYSSKYDYRHQWREFTDTLTQSEQNVPQRIITAMGGILDSDAGELWAKGANGNYRQLANKNSSQQKTVLPAQLDSLCAYLESTRWLIDIDELRTDASVYQSLCLPDSWLHERDAWLIAPLPAHDKIIGFVLIQRSAVVKSINWEDRDLLKMAGYQAAGLLAQYQSDLALMEARQFEAFNKLSAYIVHDLKNILGQQSLIVSNASRHRNNPAFFDDVIQTVDNSVQRMTRLMEQLRSGVRANSVENIEIANLLQSLIVRQSLRKPAPEAGLMDPQARVNADPERLSEVFAHIIQNAQEACLADGKVLVEVARDNDYAVITVSDNGHGMEPEFINSRLFRPFDSTKGLTGMGIGVFESREIIRALGGEITVTSTPGIRTIFTISLPASDASPRIIA